MSVQAIDVESRSPHSYPSSSPPVHDHHHHDAHVHDNENVNNVNNVIVTKSELGKGSEKNGGRHQHDDNELILPISTKTPEAEAQGSTSGGRRGGWDWEKAHAFLREEVDTDAATAPLAAFCFMTGYIDAVSFTATFIWCAFQTGNTIQLSLALARLFSGPDRGPAFKMPDRQALVSLLSFLGGSFLGGRIGDRIGSKSRGWLALGTLLQSGLTLSSSLCALYSSQSGFSDSRADPSWTNTLGFLALGFASASMGLQALIGTRIGAHLATTVVLTSIWVQVISDPVLFRLKHTYKRRDYKILGIFSLFCGGLVGRALTGTIGPAGTLGIGAGLRLLIMFSWLFVAKAKKTR